MGVGLLTRLPKGDIEFEAFSDRIFRVKIISFRIIIVGVYSPTDCGLSDSEKTTFYDCLNTVVGRAEVEAR